MTIYNCNSEKGICSVGFCMDHNRLETWFETTIAIYSTPTANGIYKTYQFATLKAARRKFDQLREKHGI